MMEKTRGMGREVRYGSSLTATATATATDTTLVFLSYFFKAILISSCVITPSPSVSNWENALMSACSVGFFQFVMSRRSAWKGKGRGSQVSWKVLGRRENKVGHSFVSPHYPAYILPTRQVMCPTQELSRARSQNVLACAPYPSPDSLSRSLSLPETGIIFLRPQQ